MDPSQPFPGFLPSTLHKSSPPTVEEEISLAHLIRKTPSSNWRDVGRNIEQMDSLYGASFGHWLKNEENVTMTSNFLCRVANDYPIDRIANALKWLFSGWMLASIAVVVRQVTSDWVENARKELIRNGNTAPTEEDVVTAAETRRALLIREVTRDWNCSQIAQLVGTLANFWISPHHSEVFLRGLTKTWDFCRLSEFFSLLPPSFVLDYRVKVAMLQDTAKDRRAAHPQRAQVTRQRKRSCSELADLEESTEAKRPRTFSTECSGDVAPTNAVASPGTTGHVRRASEQRAQRASLLTTRRCPERSTRTSAASADGAISPTSSPTTTVCPSPAPSEAPSQGQAVIPRQVLECDPSAACSPTTPFSCPPLPLARHSDAVPSTVRS
ncbi:hypothetical protein H4R35_006978 [Dimargaris xerosporica]|nr:hypothetical protein H4R35_006978 [Dimargaris xerosporica]